MFHFAGNYGKDRRFTRSEWLCLCGEENEEESQLMGARYITAVSDIQERSPNRAEFGPEQGSKQPIPPSLN